MGFIIVTRNPRNKKLLVLVDESCTDTPSEFKTEDEAHSVAGDHALCRAWNYDVLKVEGV